MNVRNCRKCGRIYNYIVGPNVCPQCRKLQEAKFQEVKKFVMENKGSGIQDIAQNCDVEVPQIQQWIREERLVFSEDSPISIECETCGAMIKTGRYCNSCKANTANTLSGSIRKNEISQNVKKELKDNPKMRFLDR
ncbi:MAG TPA: flagellar protein [Lachnospiraceae bacterium]|nr:flagellar protein [Lachnospiraceae bacterium]